MVEWIVICSALTVLDDEIVKATEASEGKRGLQRLRPAPGTRSDVGYKGPNNEAPQLDAKGPSRRGRAISRKESAPLNIEAGRSSSRPRAPQRARTYDERPAVPRENMPQLSRLQLYDGPAPALGGPQSAPPMTVMSRNPSSNESYLTAPMSVSSQGSGPLPSVPVSAGNPSSQRDRSRSQRSAPSRAPSPLPIPGSSPSRSRSPAKMHDKYSYDTSSRPIPLSAGYDPRQQAPNGYYEQSQPHGPYSAPLPPQPQDYAPNPTSYSIPNSIRAGKSLRAPSGYKPGSRPVRSEVAG
jgi:hypothetical protein